MDKGLTVLWCSQKSHKVVLLLSRSNLGAPSAAAKILSTLTSSSQGRGDCLMEIPLEFCPLMKSFSQWSFWRFLCGSLDFLAIFSKGWVYPKRKENSWIWKGCPSPWTPAQWALYHSFHWLFSPVGFSIFTPYIFCQESNLSLTCCTIRLGSTEVGDCLIIDI